VGRAERELDLALPIHQAELHLAREHPNVVVRLPLPNAWRDELQIAGKAPFLVPLRCISLQREPSAVGLEGEEVPDVAAFRAARFPPL
jgi:hypothetical protein